VNPQRILYRRLLPSSSSGSNLLNIDVGEASKLIKNMFI